jgi:tRNA 2-thiouridine synthesizing protein A
MTKTIDARGLSCPQPVLMTLDEISSGNETRFAVLVDNDAAKENVTRAAESRNWRVSEVSEDGGDYSIIIVKD